MTRNQLTYQQMLETKRSNLANETETHRANVAKERENFRSNRAKEVETNRSNLAHETETNRANIAKEAETHRANVEDERLRPLEAEMKIQAGIAKTQPFAYSGARTLAGIGDWINTKWKAWRDNPDSTMYWAYRDMFGEPTN